MAAALLHDVGHICGQTVSGWELMTGTDNRHGEAGAAWLAQWFGEDVTEPVRLLSGRPVMIERTAFPERVGALVAGIDLDHESIYERLGELGLIFADAEHVIDSVPATADDARLLDTRPRVPLLRERRRTTDPAGVPIEWSEDRYLGSEVAFTVHNSVAVSALTRLPSDESGS